MVSGLKWCCRSSSCQAASTFISGVVSMAEQGETEQNAYIAFCLISTMLTMLLLGHQMNAVSMLHFCCFSPVRPLWLCAHSSNFWTQQFGVLWLQSVHSSKQLQIARLAPHRPSPDDSASGTSSSSANLLVLCNKSSPAFWPAFHGHVGPAKHRLYVYLVCMHMAWLWSGSLYITVWLAWSCMSSVLIVHRCCRSRQPSNQSVHQGCLEYRCLSGLRNCLLLKADSSQHNMQPPNNEGGLACIMLEVIKNHL